MTYEGVPMHYSSDQDSLNTLSLEMLPLHCEGLKKTRLVKNSRLETMLELFSDDKSGQGQIPVSAMSSAFKTQNPKDLKHDYDMVRAISILPSYDVYSLRIDLRRLGINVNDSQHLKLSEQKQKELAPALHQFTMPLIKQVYGNDSQDIQSVDDILSLFRSSDRKTALDNLQRISESLDVSIDEIPSFIEDYGDIFLSLVYFKSEVLKISPAVDAYIASLEKSMKNNMLRQDPHAMSVVKKVHQQLSEIMRSLTGRIQVFEYQFNNIWDDINKNSFYKIRDLIMSNHQSIGLSLCSLAVKMEIWNENFPKGDPSNTSLMEFTRKEIMTGLEGVLRCEKIARAKMLSDVAA